MSRMARAILRRLSAHARSCTYIESEVKFWNTYFLAPHLRVCGVCEASLPLANNALHSPASKEDNKLELSEPQDKVTAT